MKIVATILIIFLVRCVHLHPANEFDIFKIASNGLNDNVNNAVSNALDLSHSCIFGPKSMSMVLYNSRNPEGKNIGEDESCSNIDSNKPVVFIVHGFISSANTTNTYELASQFVEKEYTVFSLDWSDAACENGIPIIKVLEYPQAVKNTREIGELMAKYVILLRKNCSISQNNILFIGHSLGAHVCGFAAKHIQKSGFGTILTIIGADPASPLFGDNNCEERLCDTDAKNLIILHTSILGISKPIGHVDLYFNGGEKQPDCGLLDLDVVCSHSRSIVYLYDILANTCVYPGVKISSSLFHPNSNTTDCIIVNDQIFNIKPDDKLRKGEYSVFVQSKPPFCKKENSSSCNSLVITAK